jgi:pyrroloquinoline quinone biosynthesis protein B
LVSGERIELPTNSLQNHSLCSHHLTVDLFAALNLRLAAFSARIGQHIINAGSRTLRVLAAVAAFGLTVPGSIATLAQNQKQSGSPEMGRLTAIVLGAAGGGGYPQWNCRCAVCQLAWARDWRVKPRTQASVAVSADGEHWTLLNTSPDLRAQLLATRSLQPRTAPRGTPIAAVVLTGAEVDQIAGLLTLRERQNFTVFATAETIAALTANPIFGVLAAETVTCTAVACDAPFSLPGGMTAELFAVPGKVALYLEGEDPALAAETGANVGVELVCGSGRLAYVPGAAGVTAEMRARLARADVIFFDGTLFVDDEMILTGTGSKTGRRMGHMPIDGEGGTLAALAGLPGRRILTHINNTNPILIEDSIERRKVVAAGFEIAEDGMEIVL